MINKGMLSIVSPRPSDTGGLAYSGDMEERDGMILAGEARSPATGETYQIKDGYLDLLKSRTGGSWRSSNASSAPSEEAATSTWVAPQASTPAASAATSTAASPLE